MFFTAVCDNPFCERRDVEKYWNSVSRINRLYIVISDLPVFLITSMMTGQARV